MTEMYRMLEHFETFFTR